MVKSITILIIYGITISIVLITLVVIPISAMETFISYISTLFTSGKFIIKVFALACNRLIIVEGCVVATAVPTILDRRYI